MSRRVGLSRQSKAPSLLKNIGGQSSIHDEIEAPPASTDEESDPEPEEPSMIDELSSRPNLLNTNPFRASTLGRAFDSDSSGDERTRKAAIRPATFRVTRSQSPNKASTRIPTRIPSPVKKHDDNENDSRKNIRAQHSRPLPEHQPGPYTGTSRPSKQPVSSETPSSSGDHLRDELGFTKKRPSKTTYGKRSVPSSQSESTAAAETSSKRLRAPKTAYTTPKKDSKFRVPEKLLSSPDACPKFRGIEDSFDNFSSDEEQVAKAKAMKRQNEFNRQNPPTQEESTPEPEQKAVFKLPTNFLAGSISSYSVRPTVPFDDDSFLSDVDVSDILNKQPHQNVAVSASTCPWCGEEVDKALLDDFNKNKEHRLTVAMQTRFCRRHKTHSAKSMYNAKHYPEIDWHNLEDRFAKFNSDLRSVINGGSSHFRTLHQEAIRAGKGRVIKEDENMNPGYYGSRGLTVMSDYIVRQFGDELKKRALTDDLIASRGSAAFIQCVLVGELGTRMIMDDMSVGKSQALEILEESKALGSMINDDGYS